MSTTPLERFASRPRSYDGIPMARSKVPVRPEELEEVDYATQAHSRSFWTDNEEDMAAYQDVMQGLIQMSKLRLGRDLEQFVPERQAFVLFVRWADIEGHLPEHLRRMEHHYG